MKTEKKQKENLKLIIVCLIAEFALLYLISSRIGLTLQHAVDIIGGGILLPVCLDNFKKTFNSLGAKLKTQKTSTMGENPK